MFDGWLFARVSLARTNFYPVEYERNKYRIFCFQANFDVYAISFPETVSETEMQAVKIGQLAINFFIFTRKTFSSWKCRF